MSYGGRARYGLGASGLGSSSISSPGIYSHSPAVSSLLRSPSSSSSRLSPGGLHLPSISSTSIPSVPYSARPRSPIGSSYRSQSTNRSRSPQVPSYSQYTPKDAGVLQTIAPTYSKKYYGLRPSKSTSSVVPEPSSSSDKYRNRFGSSSPLQDGVGTPSRLSDKSQTASPSSSTTSLNEYSTLDYKKLYFDIKEDNERLRKKMSTSESELDQTKQELQKTQRNMRNSLIDGDKREKRALERKVSELEEELKEFEKVQSDNQRLRDENKALVRVISKLSK